MTTKNIKNKNFIFLKSSVIALGIVFLVLLALLVILKLNKDKNQNQNHTKTLISCNQEQIVVINNEVEKLMDAKDEIIILTKAKSGHQELVLLDKRCGFLKRKIKLMINNHPLLNK